MDKFKLIDTILKAREECKGKSDVLKAPVLEQALDEIAIELAKDDSREQEDGFFKVIRMHRDDIESLGFDASGVSDADMNDMADTMSDVLVENYFWDILRELCEERGLPEKEEEDEDDNETEEEEDVC